MQNTESKNGSSKIQDTWKLIATGSEFGDTNDEHLYIDANGGWHVAEEWDPKNNKVTDVTFKEAAKWCAQKLIPAPFSEYFLKLSETTK